MHYKKTYNEDQFSLLNNRINELMRQVEYLEEIIRQQKDQIQNLGSNDENAFLKEKIKLLEKESTAQIEYYEELLLQHKLKAQEQTKKIKDEYQQFLQKIDQLEMKIQIVLNENDRLTQQLNKTTLDDSIKVQNVQLNDLLGKLQQENQNLKQKYEQITHDLIIMTQERDNLNLELLQQKSQINQIKSQYIHQSEQLNQKDVECSELVNQISYLQNQVHTQVQQNKDLKRLNDEKTNFIDSLKMENQELTQQVVDNNCNMLKQKCVFLERELKNTLNELKQYKQERDIAIQNLSMKYENLINHQ